MKLRIRKSTLLCCIYVIFGCLLGLVWLLPVYVAPLQGNDLRSAGSSRALRVIIPTVIALVTACTFGVKRKILGLDLLAAIVFFAWPFVIWLFGDMSVAHLTYIELPLLFSGVCLLSFSIWPRWALDSLIGGVGLAAFGLAALRVLRFGFETSNFYFRPRLHLGFNHPLVTTGAIFTIALACMALCALIQSRVLRASVLGMILLAAALFIKLADSRNMILFTVILASIALARAIVRNRNYWRFIYLTIGVAAAVCFSILMTYGGLNLNIDDPTPGVASSLASRLESFEVAVKTMILGNGAIFAYPELHNANFALTDSVFTSYWMHFGIVGFAILVLFMIVLGMRISSRIPVAYFDYVGFGGFWAVMIFFLADAQGITPANLPIYLTLVMVYRIAEKPAPSQIGNNA